MTRTRTLTRPRAVSVVVCLLVAVALLAPQSIAKRLTLQQDNRLLKHEPTQRGAERRIALVIGNGVYEKAGRLKNPPNDATLLAATLKTLGFEVTVGADKSQREMKQLIREFGRRLSAGGGVGLFYFAGHGVQARGHNYLIPVDAEIQSEADLEDAAVDVNYVLNLMEDAQNALNIVILDACRNNPFVRSFRSGQEGLAQVKAPTGTLIAYATAPDSVAADGGGANSPYAEELTKQIQVAGVLLETMFRRVAEQVSVRSGGRQEPWYSANVKGDFFFSKSPTSLSLSNPSTQIDAVAVEREYWETIRSSNDPQNYTDYLQSYPNGAYAAVARAKIRQLEAEKNSKTSVPLPKSVTSQQGIEMVYIPPGRFMMGSNSVETEKPAHQVTIGQAFYVGKYEVTQGQWKAVMGRNPSRFKGDNLPVEMVSWDDAVAFIARLNAQHDGYSYRLPTEAEWEYACRAGTAGDYAGDPDTMAWYANNSGQLRLDAAEIFRTDSANYEKRITENGGQTHPVGSKLVNSFGLFDMLGNVAEWCQDWYHDSYSGAPSDGSAWLSGGEQKYRVLRGGSWHFSISGSLRSADRSSYATQGTHVDFLGFRVVAVMSGSENSDKRTSANNTDGDGPFELSYWESIKDSLNPADYDDYLKRYPSGRFADLARRRIASAIITYVNRRTNFSGELAGNFVAFSFDYPSSWERDPTTGIEGSPNFVKVEKLTPDGLTTVENFAVGHFTDPKGKMSDMVAQLCEQFSKTNPEFKKVSEGESVIGPYGGHEFRFMSHRLLGNGEFYIWGRTLLLYDASRIRGVVLVMLASSKSKDVHGVSEVGEKGELPIILKSFKFLQQ